MSFGGQPEWLRAGHPACWIYTCDACGRVMWRKVQVAQQQQQQQLQNK
jgi:hypothetical protein